MIKETVLTAAGRLYAEAYKEHYETKDSLAALMGYKSIVAEYPDSEEAGYSRSQIQNIMRNVVPKQVLYENQLDLASNYAKRKEPSDTRPIETTSPALKISS